MDRVGKKYRKRQRSKYAGLEHTALDVEIAKYLRFKVPRKSTTMQKQAVEYFVGSKAVDALMESKWAERKKGTKQTFVVREDATKCLNDLLRKRFFYRVMKNEKEPKKKDPQEEGKEESEKPKPNQEEDKNTEVPETKLRKRKVKKNSDDTEEDKNEDSKSNKTKDKTKNKSKDKEKKSKDKVKKRYKLTEHDDQVFFDSKDIYIWLYNPVSWRTIIMGMGVLLLVVAGTLFPLWPPEVRIGVYYLSVAGGGFIGSIFAVALARTFLYGMIWLFTGGKHQLWILPNILADVGFFDSFKPWYTYEYKGSTESEEDDEQEEGEQDSDDEDEKDVEVEGDESKAGGDCGEAAEKTSYSQSEHSTNASEGESTQ